MMRGRTVLALLTLTSTNAHAQLDHFGGGGLSRSTDGRWRIWSHPPEADEADSAVAWLSGPGTPKRALFRYERGADVIWFTDRRAVLVETRTVHFEAIKLFTLGSLNRFAPDKAQSDIENVLAARLPRLSVVEDRFIARGLRFRTSPCILVEEAGLPPGRNEGSFVVRRAAFHLDFATGRARQIAHCPGARIR